MKASGNSPARAPNPRWILMLIAFLFSCAFHPDFSIPRKAERTLVFRTQVQEIAIAQDWKVNNQSATYFISRLPRLSHKVYYSLSRMILDRHVLYEYDMVTHANTILFEYREGDDPDQVRDSNGIFVLDSNGCRIPKIVRDVDGNPVRRGSREDWKYHQLIAKQNADNLKAFEAQVNHFKTSIGAIEFVNYNDIPKTGPAAGSLSRTGHLRQASLWISGGGGWWGGEPTKREKVEYSTGSYGYFSGNRKIMELPVAAHTFVSMDGMSAIVLATSEDPNEDIRSVWLVDLTGSKGDASKDCTTVPLLGRRM